MLIQKIKENGIEIEFLLLPYHPIVYDHFLRTQKYHNVVEVEKLIKKFAHENQILTFGSYDPDSCGLTNMYFYDDMHLKLKGIELVLAKQNN